MRILTGAVLLSILLSCESSDLTGPTGGDSKKDSSDAQGDDAADEPVMVGGAHLTCVDLSEQRPAAETQEIGCALNDSRTGGKIDLSKYSTVWSVTGKGDATVSIENAEGGQGDRYHRKYSYQDQSYLEHTVRVKITSQDQRTIEYQRQLAVLDPAFDFNQMAQTPDLTASLLLNQDFNVPSGCSSLYLNNRGENNNRDSNTGCDEGTAMMSSFASVIFNTPCWKGRLSDSFALPRGGVKDEPLHLGGDTCIVQTAEIHIQDANWGCYKVPISNKGEFQIAIIEGSKISPQQMTRLAYQYACKGSN